MVPMRTVDLEPLRRAIDRNDLDAITAYLEGLPQRIKNGYLEAAGNRFGFLTAEEEDARHMLAADLSQRLHRSSNTSALRELLLRWGRPLISLRSVAYDTQYSLKVAFGIPKKAAWTLFATWDHFAIACINSQTPMAREMKEFFLHAGEQFAMNTVAEAETGFSVRQLEAIANRLDSIEQRLTVPTGHDVAEQQVLAMRIASFESLGRAGQIMGIRVGGHNMGLAFEALAGQVAGLPVQTLKARDLHRSKPRQHRYWWRIHKTPILSSKSVA